MEAHEERLSTSDVAATSAERPVDDEQRFEREQDATTQEAPTQAQAATTDGTADVDPLLPQAQETDLRAQWEEIQTRFVDDPRRAVEDADALVAGVMKSLAEGFAQARTELEDQWSRGEDVGTEDLRVALQRYRAFFQRLLSA